MKRLIYSAVLLTAITLGPAAAQTPPPAYLTLGGYNILCLRGTAGGLTPSQRVEVITDRVTPLLGNPVILPSDVVVYLPPAASQYNRYPVIYALGRRIVTVDPATVKASGLVQTPLQAATLWAKRLQQVLPRVNWRPSNAPNTKVPANPPLTVTPDFAQVGGQVATATLHDKVILKLRGPQTGGMTAAERADLLTARLERLAALPAASLPNAVQVTPLPTGDATLALAGTPIITVAAADTAGSGFTTPVQLASAWAKNLRFALAASPGVLPSAPLGEPPTAAALPPSLISPAASGPSYRPGGGRKRLARNAVAITSTDGWGSVVVVIASIRTKLSFRQEPVGDNRLWSLRPDKAEGAAAPAAHRRPECRGAALHRADDVPLQVLADVRHQRSHQGLQLGLRLISGKHLHDKTVDVQIGAVAVRALPVENMERRIIRVVADRLEALRDTQPEAAVDDLRLQKAHQIGPGHPLARINRGRHIRRNHVRRRRGQPQCLGRRFHPVHGVFRERLDVAGDEDRPQFIVADAISEQMGCNDAVKRPARQRKAGGWLQVRSRL